YRVVRVADPKALKCGPIIDVVHAQTDVRIVARAHHSVTSVRRVAGVDDPLTHRIVVARGQRRDSCRGRGYITGKRQCGQWTELDHGAVLECAVVSHPVRGW